MPAHSNKALESLMPFAMRLASLILPSQLWWRETLCAGVPGPRTHQHPISTLRSFGHPRLPSPRGQNPSPNYPSQFVIRAAQLAVAEATKGGNQGAGFLRPPHTKAAPSSSCKWQHWAGPDLERTHVNDIRGPQRELAGLPPRQLSSQARNLSMAARELESPRAHLVSLAHGAGAGTRPTDSQSSQEAQLFEDIRPGAKGHAGRKVPAGVRLRPPDQPPTPGPWVIRGASRKLSLRPAAAPVVFTPRLLPWSRRG